MGDDGRFDTCQGLERLQHLAVERARRGDAELHGAGLGLGFLHDLVQRVEGADGAHIDDLRIEEDVHHRRQRSEEHTSELQSLMRISYAVFCLKKKKQHITTSNNITDHTHTTTTKIYNPTPTNVQHTNP